MAQVLLNLDLTTDLFLDLRPNRDDVSLVAERHLRAALPQGARDAFGDPTMV
jgi:hypothetical protein